MFHSPILSHGKLLAERLRGVVPDVHLDIGDAHLGALANQTTRKSKADALGSPSHNGPLAPDRERHLDGENLRFLILLHVELNRWSL